MSSGDEFGFWSGVGQSIPSSLRQEIGEAIDELETESELLDAYDSEEAEEEEEEEEYAEDEEAEYSDYESDIAEEYLEAQLLDAQQQWEESLEQLNKVLNWILLPLLGKFLGRRVAKSIWKQAMEYIWR